MISDFVLALGLVAVIEGLVITLAPNYIEAALKLLSEMQPEARRILGLLIAAFGVAVVWFARNVVA